ncbi:Ig-like domain-containing protein [Microbacterium arthrosphaerae]|uniref:Ig-like domain-containing protein n=1 Tax=Microbacterium arthrosphaerae TaxID=792652 RepID=UPI0035E487D0
MAAATGLTAPTLADGSHTVNAVAADAVGNTSPVSNTNTFTVDTTAPAAPVVVAPANGSTTADSTPTISGTAVPGSTVTVRIDGSAIAPTATADGSGNWMTAPTLADGSHTVNAVAADAVGNTSPVSNTNTFTVDTTAPAAPVVVTPADGSTTADDTPTVSGTAEAGATVTVSIDGAAIAPAATADGSGNWSVTAPTLADGAHTANAVATDAGGNTSPVSNTNTFTVDTAAPAAPVITTPVNNAVLNDATPPIGGTAEAGATVTVTIDGVVAGTTTATGGNWTFTPGEPLADGPHTVVATAADAAGNTSGPSDAVAFVVDTAAPAAPIITSPANDDVLTDSTPTITGSAEADSTVTVIIDGEVAGTTTADGTGAWSFTPASPLADGEHTVTATARDAAGNTGPEAEEVIFTIDTVAPLAPVITAPVGGSTTNDATPAITGTAEPGSTVTVVIDGTTAGTTTADGTGAWTFTPASPLADGEHTVSATATDAAGQVSPASDEVTFTVDTTPPAAPIITSPQNGATTDDATPPVTGTAEPGSTVAVIIDGTLAGSTTANGQGAWTFTPTSPLGAGAHTITASATDAAGNVGPASAPVTVTVRVLAPVSPAAPASSGLAATGGTTPLAVGTFGMILLALGLITLRSRHRRVS